MSNQRLFKLVHRASVLIVEPSTELRVSVARLFDKSRVRVLAAKCGKDALKLAPQLVKPSVAIIEYSLPDISGIEVAVHLNTIIDCPVILTTSNSTPEMVAEMLDLVAEDVLSKPYETTELGARVHRLLLRQSHNMSLNFDFGSSKQPRIVFNGNYFQNIIEQ